MYIVSIFLLWFLPLCFFSCTIQPIGCKSCNKRLTDWLTYLLTYFSCSRTNSDNAINNQNSLARRQTLLIYSSTMQCHTSHTTSNVAHSHNQVKYFRFVVLPDFHAVFHGHDDVVRSVIHALFWALFGSTYQHASVSTVLHILINCICTINKHFCLQCPKVT